MRRISVIFLFALPFQMALLLEYAINSIIRMSSGFNVDSCIQNNGKILIPTFVLIKSCFFYFVLTQNDTQAWLYLWYAGWWYSRLEMRVFIKINQICLVLSFIHWLYLPQIRAHLVGMVNNFVGFHNKATANNQIKFIVKRV